MLDERDLPDSGEAFRRAERLRRRADFLKCYRRGRRWRGSLTTIFAAPNELGHPRLGITVSRKVGGAVVRVRIKRRIREIYRRWNERRELDGTDLVVHVSPRANGAGFRELRQETMRLLGKIAKRRSPAPSAAD